MQRNTVGSVCHTMHCWLPQGSFPRVPTATERGESLSFLFVVGIRFKQMRATSCRWLGPSSSTFLAQTPNAYYICHISVWFDCQAFNSFQICIFGKDTWLDRTIRPSIMPKWGGFKAKQDINFKIFNEGKHTGLSLLF